MKLLLNAFALAIITCSLASAQEIKDSVHVLKEVAVQADRLSGFTIGNKIQDIDSGLLANYQGNNLAELLSGQSQVFINSYGPGLLAVTSLRGADAAETTILWNGFSLLSPMSAELDLALVPVDFLQDVKIQYGGSSALFGSGAIGGSIHLDNSAVYDKGIAIGVNSSYGSFNNQQQGVNIQLSEKKIISSIKIFEKTSKNDFPFMDIAQFGNPIVRQRNAELNQQGIMQENYYKINDKQDINLRLWYENTSRDIPPTMTEQDTVANQKDISFRITSQWQRQGENSALSVRAAYFDEQLNYIDPYVSLISLSHSKSIIIEAEDKINISKNQTINIGLNNTYGQAVSAGYPNTPRQNRTSMFCSYKLANSNGLWNAILNAREEVIDGVITPFSPSVGVERILFKWLTLKSSVSKNYRVPSFNDLYWNPGGDPNLKPENGWSEDAGLYFKLQLGTFSLQVNASAYNSQTENLITWLPPGAGQSYWYATNINTVWSRGLEYMFNVNWTTNRIRLQLSGMYNFVLSTDATGDQLIYVPVQSASGNFSVYYKKIAFTYNETYTGYRYETSDNTQWMYPYQLGNIIISKGVQFKNTKLKFFGRVNNVWNEAYQVIAWYAMPLRNYQVGLSIEFNKANK